MKIENRREKKKHQRINQAKPSLHVKRKKNGKQNPVTLKQQHWGALVHICSLKFSFQFFLSKKEKKKKVLFPIWGENILVSPGRKHSGLTSFFFPPLPSTKHPQKKFSLILSLSLSLSLSKIHPTKYTLNVTLKKKTLFSQSLPFKATKRLPPYFVITHCFLSCQLVSNKQNNGLRILFQFQTSLSASRMSTIPYE